VNPAAPEVQPRHSQKEIIWPTPHGNLRVISFCTPEQIRAFIFDSEFKTYAQYRSIYTRRETLEEKAADPDANVTLAVSAQKHIVGFGVLDFPDPDERWIKLGSKCMMEVKVVEVCRSWRSSRIGGVILKLLLTHPDIEEMIIYLVGYSWTWDLDGSGLTAQQYRRMLVRLYEKYGFKEYETNEPNVSLKPENFFMAKIGKNISAEEQTRFKWLRFGIIEQIQ
jgi:acetoin utilization protein AcuA